MTQYVYVLLVRLAHQKEYQMYAVLSDEYKLEKYIKELREKFNGITFQFYKQLVH